MPFPTEQQVIERRTTATPPEGCPFQVGELVTFRNMYGVRFPDRRIIGFKPDTHDWRREHCIFLSKEAYWFPKQGARIIKQ